MKKLFYYLLALTYGQAISSVEEKPSVYTAKHSIQAKKNKKSHTRQNKKKLKEHTSLLQKMMAIIFFSVVVFAIWYKISQMTRDDEEATNNDTKKGAIINFRKRYKATEAEDERVLKEIILRMYLKPNTKQQKPYFETKGAYNRFLRSVQGHLKPKKEVKKTLLTDAKKAIKKIYLYEVSPEQAATIWNEKMNLNLDPHLDKIIEVQQLGEGFTLQRHYKNDEKSPTAVPAFANKNLEAGGYFRRGNAVEETYATESAIIPICYKYIQAFVKKKHTNPNEAKAHYELVKRAFLFQDIPRYAIYGKPNNNKKKQRN